MTAGHQAETWVRKRSEFVARNTSHRPQQSVHYCHRIRISILFT